MGLSTTVPLSPRDSLPPAPALPSAAEPPVPAVDPELPAAPPEPELESTPPEPRLPPSPLEAGLPANPPEPDLPPVPPELLEDEQAPMLTTTPRVKSAQTGEEERDMMTILSEPPKFDSSRP